MMLLLCCDFFLHYTTDSADTQAAGKNNARKIRIRIHAGGRGIMGEFFSENFTAVLTKWRKYDTIQTENFDKMHRNPLG